MGKRPTASVLLRYVHKLVNSGGDAHVSDGQLLRRFLVERDEAAFQVLFRRHAPMVLAAGRRVLGSEHDAEDVCQAAFLLLAKKGPGLRLSSSLGGWLHKTGHHLALKVLRTRCRRSRRESRAKPPPTVNPLAEITGQELLTVLDEELLRLPEPLRAPLVLCYLEGATRDEAAQQLGWPMALVKRRLEQGRERLHTALVRRGVGLSVVLLHALTCRNAAQAAATAVLAGRMARAASALVAGKSIAGIVPAPIIRLLEGGLGTMSWFNCKVAIGVLLLGGILSTAGVFARGDLKGNSGAEPLPAAPRGPQAVGGGVLAAAPVREKAAADETQMDAWWADLEKEEAEATRALLKFAGQSKASVAYFKKKMKPLKIDAARVRSLLTKLASDKEEVWKPAFEEFEYFDPRLAIDLETLMKEVTEAPARQRMVQVLSGPQARALEGMDVQLRELNNGEGFNFTSGNGSWWAEHRVERINTHGWVTRKSWVRAVRVIVLLEHIGTPSAVAILQDMASGHADAQPTRAAREALTVKRRVP
jgi:RNA polymerase sigma factor (sigma-70 family)